MHSLSQVVEATEGEGQVRETSTYMAVGALFSNSGGGLNEINSVVVMLLHASGDSEYVEVEYDVLG